MKKAISLLLSMTLALAVSACSSGNNTSTASNNTSTAASTASAVSESASSAKGLEVNKGLFDVTITLPASMFKDQNIDEVVTNAKKEGVGEVTKNNDGSVTYKMSKATHNKMMAEIKNSLEKSINDVKSGKDFKSIKDITYNNDFSEISLIVNKSEFDNSMDGLAALGLFVTSAYYQAFNGTKSDDIKTKFNIVDQATKKVVSTAVYPDDLGTASSK